MSADDADVIGDTTGLVVWSHPIVPAGDDGHGGTPEHAGRILAQTHQRAEDARVAAQAAARTASNAREAASALSAPLAKINALASDAASTSDAARMAAGEARRAADRATGEAQAARKAAEYAAAALSRLERPGLPSDAIRGAGDVFIGAQAQPTGSMRPREYRKATGGAGIAAAVYSLFTAWQADWDLDAISQQDVSGLIALVGVVFPTVFGLGNRDHDEPTRRELRRTERRARRAFRARHGEQD